MSEESTTPDLVELTRSFYASLNGRDFDAFMARFGPASVWDVSRWGLGSHAGLDAIRRYLEDWFGNLDEYEMQVDEVHGLGNGIVFAVVAQVTPGVGHRGLLRVRSGAVFVWVESIIARVTLYPKIDEGRAAAVRAADPLAQRNIDVHSHLVEAGRAREVPDQLLAPNFRIENHASAATDHTYYGAEGLLELASDLIEIFAAEPRWGVEEVIAASKDFVVATFSIVGLGAHSKEPLDFRWAGVTWFRDGKASRAIGYASRREALEAVGLKE
ncbi:MAG TPA: nuclear transport factor 2 family protein [Solirubrobacteraceae bacterium]